MEKDKIIVSNIEERQALFDGAEFLRTFGKAPDGPMYFVLNGEICKSDECTSDDEYLYTPQGQKISRT